MSLTDKFRPPKSKACNSCKIEKPLNNFPIQTENKDGRHNKCRDCLKEVEAQKKANLAEYAKNYFTF